MGDDRKTITGGCLCGAVRYELDEPPSKVGYCHCSMCRKNMGGLFGVAAFVDRDHIHYTNNEPTWYSSSASAQRGFCKRCGSPIAWRHTTSEYYSVWLGSLDHPERYEPVAHYNLEEKIPWVDIHEKLPDATAEGPSRIFGTYQSD